MKRLFTMLIFFGLTNVSYAATPIISNVTGTISTGQTLTITGSNMVQEVKTNWSQFNKAHTNADGFEGTNPVADGYSAIGPAGGTYDSGTKVLGSKSMKFHLDGPISGVSVGNYNAFTIGGATSDMWYRYYVRYHAANNIWFNNYAKQLYVMGNKNDYLDLYGTSDYSMPTSMYYWDGDPNRNGSLPARLQNDRWYLMEVHFKSSGSAVTEVYVDGTRIINDTPNELNKTPLAVLFGIPNANGATSSLSLDCWWDGLVAATSRVYPASKIEISNNATYGAGTVKYQEPIYLSDGTVQLKADLSGLGSGPFYLWVTNNQQQRSAVYNLSTGQSGGSDTQAPTNPASLTASAVSSSQINLSWSASTDNTTVTGYKIYRGGTYLATSTGTSYSNTGLSASTSYTYTVSAIDAAGNESGQSSSTSATTFSAVITDTTSPSTPSGLSATATSSSQVNLSWSASTDNVGVTGYKIYRGGVYLALTTSTSYADTDLSASTLYSYKVSAVDASGNESSQSSSASATTSSSPGQTQGTTLFQETFNDTNFSARGWYDGGTTGITSSNCYSGSCAQFSFAQGVTSPSAPYDGAMRKQFTATDSLYMSYYIKFATGWRGSQQTYHPHIIYVLSDLDSAYSGLAINYLDTYSEFISDIGSPYTIRPSISMQDTLNTNSSSGTLPNNITATTENRSVNYCNGYKTGQDSGTSSDCYSISPYWYSATTWMASNASVSTNAWHHVEIYFKMNSISGNKGQPDGIMQEWIDGTQVINKSNIIYRTNQHPTMKWAQFVIAPFIGDGSPIAQTFYMDELTLTTAPPNSSSVTAPTVSIISVDPN